MKKIKGQCAFALLLGGLFVATVCATRAEQLAPITVAPQPTQVITMTQGKSTTISVAIPFRTIHITNPDIVDIVLTTDRTATLVPKAPGATNVDFFDEKNLVIAGVNVVVNVNELAVQTRIYDHHALTSYTSYHCTPDVCQYFEETVTKEPAPQATENVNKNYNYNSRGGPPQ
jgi:hypothetical protein